MMMNNLIVYEFPNYRESYCKKFDYPEGGVSFEKRQFTIYLEFPSYHPFCNLTPKEQLFYANEGEESFLRHKYIISKALKKSQNNFTQAL